MRTIDEFQNGLRNGVQIGHYLGILWYAFGNITDPSAFGNCTPTFNHMHAFMKNNIEEASQ